MTQLHVDVYTCPMRDLTNGGQFSPTTSTLVAGPTEIVLADAQYMESDVAEIARRIHGSSDRGRVPPGGLRPAARPAGRAGRGSKPEWPLRTRSQVLEAALGP